MKKILAFVAVFALAAVGCDDKGKSTSKTSAGTGGTYEKRDTVKVESHATVTNTVLQHTATVTETKTAAVTKTVDVPKGGPAIPPGGDGEKKKPGGQ